MNFWTFLMIVNGCVFGAVVGSPVPLPLLNTAAILALFCWQWTIAIDCRREDGLHESN